MKLLSPRFRVVDQSDTAMPDCSYSLDVYLYDEIHEQLSPGAITFAVRETVLASYNALRLRRSPRRLRKAPHEL